MQSQRIPLGFGSIPRPVYVFVKQEANCCWYMLGENDSKIYVQERALTGVIQRLILKEVETSFGKDLKADLEVLADRKYIIRSGFDSNFTKGLLLGIKALSSEVLSHPLTIAVTPGDRQTVFCHLYDSSTGEQIQIEWEKQANWLDLAQSAIARIDQAHGRQQLQAAAQTQAQTQPQTRQQQPKPAPAQTQTQQSGQPRPQAPQPSPGLYPAHNGIIKAIRAATGHDQQQIADWCRANGAERPDQIPPDKLPALVEWLALGWAVSRINIPLERLRNSYRGRVGTLTAAGVGLAEAAISWIQAQSEYNSTITKTTS